MSERATIPPSVTRSVTITRNSGWYGRARKAKLKVDGVVVGDIRAGKTVTVEVPTGARELVATMDWGRSDAFDLSEVRDGDQLDLVFYMSPNPLRLLGTPLIPARFEAKAPL